MDRRSLMRRSAEFFAGREAVVWNDRRLSFAEAWSPGLRMANALLTLGLKPGERLGTYKRPGRVELRTEPLPKSPVGKVRRKDLREPFRAGHTRRVSGN